MWTNSKKKYDHRRENKVDTNGEISFIKTIEEMINMYLPLQPKARAYWYYIH